MQASDSQNTRPVHGRIPFWMIGSFTSPSTRMKSDWISLTILAVASWILASMTPAEPSGWLGDTLLKVWLEFAAMVFFLRPLFHLPDHPSRWVQYFAGGARSLAVFSISIIPTLFLIASRSGWDGNSVLQAAYHWMVQPAWVGWGTFTVAVLLRWASEELGD